MCVSVTFAIHFRDVVLTMFIVRLRFQPHSAGRSYGFRVSGLSNQSSALVESEGTVPLCYLLF